MTADPTTGRFAVESKDPALRATLTAWLRESGLQWPGLLRIEALPVAELPVVGDAREVLTQPGLTIQSGPPDNSVRICWEGGAQARVHPTEPLATVEVLPGAFDDFERAERGFLLVVLLFVLRRVGWYHVHCAALRDPDGKGWLFVGQQMSGKSTTAALLARAGWEVATDDIAFLHREGDRVLAEGYRSPIALRSGGRELLQATGGVELARRGKSAFDAPALGGSWTTSVTPDVVVFPEVHPDTPTALEPITPREAINALIASSIWVLFEPLRAQEHLDLLGRVVSTARVFRGRFGRDLVTDPSILRELSS